ncbi:phosphotransferase enzyme family protein [Xylariaceae sp. FL0662B]|nr:phosphotransferase enzyme family protein [Xylariaceae sp. FL0662B]
MSPTIGPERVASIMLSWHSLELVSCEKMQTLWAGYGYIFEITARARNDDAAAEFRRRCRIGANDTGKTAEVFPLILKLISPPPTRPGSEDEGHLRKMMSYEVEQYFYSSIAPHLDGDVAIANCVATTRDARGKPGAELLDGFIATIMTDLRPRFPVAGEQRSELSERQVYAALDWLSGFHRTSRKLIPAHPRDFLLPPLEEARRRRRLDADHAGTTLWLNGGYTYLATRRREYAALASDTDSEWSGTLCEPVAPGGSSVSELVAGVLAPRGREHETLIHGDVKSENLFATADGGAVAFFDFQYVGLGLGVCDLAKLFTCSVPLELLVADAVPRELRMQRGERVLLQYYRSRFLDGYGHPDGTPATAYAWETFVRHWETALVDWLRFQASWGFWGNTEWLEARVRSILNDRGWIDWLKENQNIDT